SAGGASVDEDVGRELRHEARRGVGRAAEQREGFENSAGAPATIAAFTAPAAPLPHRADVELVAFLRDHELDVAFAAPLPCPAGGHRRGARAGGSRTNRDVSHAVANVDGRARGDLVGPLPGVLVGTGV